MKRISHNFALITLLAALLFTSCSQQQASLPEWLEGTWETGDSLGLITESWEKINSGYMTGEGLFVTRERKTVIEVLNIFIRDGVLVYTAMLPDQNDGEEIIFIDTTNDPDSLVFENPAHDYPKKLVYHQREANTIDVYIFGGKDDEINILTFNRIPE